jgi:hypothetical protein
MEVHKGEEKLDVLEAKMDKMGIPKKKWIGISTHADTDQYLTGFGLGLTFDNLCNRYGKYQGCDPICTYSKKLRILKISKEICSYFVILYHTF